MMNNQAIVASGLTVVRGGRTVLNDLAFTVPRGTVTGLLGPSGCGKSTLMRTLVGVQANVTGTLEVLGLPAGHPELRHRVGYVTQAPSVYADLSVRENLDYYAAVLSPGGGRTGRRARAEAVDRVLGEVDLGTHADALAANLSGGQRSRVSLAVALLGGSSSGSGSGGSGSGSGSGSVGGRGGETSGGRDAGTGISAGQGPELLVLDEPTVGLDPVLRRDLWQLFHRLAADGAAVLVSSHVMDEAERCQRLLLLRDGRLLADDTPADLRARTDSGTIEDAFLRLVEAASAQHPEEARS